MSNDTQPIEIVIRVQGILNSQTTRVEGLHIDSQPRVDAPPITTLTGVLRDEAMLEDVLDKLYTLGLPLISVEREEPDRVEPADDPAAQAAGDPHQSN